MSGATLGSATRDMRHALDPVAWAKEELGFVCDPWQARMLRSASKRVLLNCCRQAGKSQITAILAAHTAIFLPGSLILLFSKAQRQSGELFGKIAAIFKAMPNPPPLDTDNLTSCRLTNGSRIISLPGDAASTRGFSAPSLIVFDEAAFCDDGLFQAVRPMLAVSGGRLILMSTPHGKRGFFFRSWNDDGGEGWERERVTAMECPRISPVFLDAERASIGDFWFRQEYGCEFVDTADQLFSSESIEAAIAPEVRALPLRLTYGATDKWTAPMVARAVSEEELTNADLEGTGKFVIGVDLGQARDYSVVCVLEVIPVEPPRDAFGRRSDAEPIVHYRIRFLQRFKLGTPYPAIAADLMSLIGQLPSWTAPSSLWVDATGVGKAVVDTMRDAGLEPIAVTIGGGVDWHVESPIDVRVPKRQLVGSMQIVLQTHRLHVAADIPELRTWISEMESFTVRVSNSGSESYEAWSESTHDDMVLAAMLAIWGGEHPLRRAFTRFI